MTDQAVSGYTKAAKRLAEAILVSGNGAMLADLKAMMDYTQVVTTRVSELEAMLTEQGG